MLDSTHGLMRNAIRFGLCCLALFGGSPALAAPGDERIFVQELSPTGLRAFSFDGATFSAEDPAPASAGDFERTNFDSFGIAGTDRWFLFGYQGTGVSLGIMDPESGVQLPFVSAQSSFFLMTPSATGEFVIGAGRDLLVVDLRPGSSTFRQIVSSDPISTSETFYSLATNPAKTRLYLASNPLPFVSSAGTTVRVYDISDPSDPVLLDTDVVPFSAPGNSGNFAKLQYLTVDGVDYLGIGRRYVQLVPIVSGLLDVPNRIEWFGNGAYSRYFVYDLHAADTVSGPRLFVGASQYSDDAGHTYKQILVFDLDLPLPGATPMHTVDVTAPSAGADDSAPRLLPSLDGSYLYALSPGGIADIPALDSCKLSAFDVEALADGSASGPLDEIGIDSTVEVCGALTFRVAPVPPAAPAGMSITDVVVDFASPDNLLVNDVARDLTVTGSGLADVAFAYLGEAELTISLAPAPTATEVHLTVPEHVPSGNPRLVLLDSNGALAAWTGLTVNNPPTFLPGSRVYGTSFSRNSVIELNGATANQVLGEIPSGQGVGRGAVTPDGRLLLVGGFRDARVHVHALVAEADPGGDPDPAKNYDWYEEIAAPYNSFVREIEVSPDGTRAYLNAGSCWVGVLDLTARPPRLVDTDGNPATTDFANRVGVEPEQAGITRIPLGPDVSVFDCLPFSNASAISPDGDWLYLALQNFPHLVAIRLHAQPNPDLVNPATDVFELDGAFTGPLPGVGRSDGIAVSPDGLKLYFASSTETTLRVFDLPGGVGSAATQTSAVAIPGAELNDVRTIGIRPDGAELYVASRGGGSVHVFDLTGGAPSFVTEIEIGRFAEGPDPSPDNQWLYVGAAGADLTAIVDVRDGSPTQYEVLTTSGSGTYMGNPVASPGLTTPEGAAVEVQPSEETTLVFSEVVDGGNTTVTSTNVSSVTVPPNFEVDLGGAPVFYDVQTDVNFSGPVEVCFTYDDAGLTLAEEQAIRLLHEVAGVFQDVTTSLDTGANEVCGVVTSFSQFAIGKVIGPIVVDPPSPNVIAEPAGSTSFTVRATEEPTGTVTIPLSVVGTDCTLAGGVTEVELDSSNYLAGVAVGVDVVDDGDTEAQELCAVVTGNSVAPSDPTLDAIDVSDVAILIDDDDSTDLSITKSDGLVAAPIGSTLIYTITLTNRLSIASTGVTFEDDIPDDVTLVDVDWISGGSNPAWNEVDPVVGGVDLDAGESATFEIEVTIDGDASGVITNMATITSSGSVADLDAGNDSATDETRVSDGTAPKVANVNSFADTGDGTLGAGEVVEVGISEISITFDEPLGGSPGAYNRYQLYQPGPDLTFETGACPAPVAASDQDWGFDSVSYSNPTTTLDPSGSTLPDGIYQLRACATLGDLEGNPLDGDGNGTGGDDFVRTFLVDTAPPTVQNVTTVDDTGDGNLGGGEATNVAITEIRVTFNEPMNPALAASAANYLLVGFGDNQSFDTTDCASGVQIDDSTTTPSGVTYDVPTRTATIAFVDPLPEDAYRLFVCGSTSVEDLAGRKLDGNYDTTPGDDFVLEFVVDQTPPELPETVESSHDGGPSEDGTIDVWWYGNTTDNLSGISGFSWEFSTSPTGSCDETIDSGSEDATSPWLAPGDWYFHLCAVDGAGNWSDASSYGPWTVTAPVPVKVAGPFRITVPAGFTVPGFSFVDQVPSSGTVEVDVFVYQTGPRVEFLTNDVSPSGLPSIGSTLVASDEGTAQGGFLLQGRVHAYGVRPGQGQTVWTPRLNGGASKAADAGGNASVGDNSCGTVTLPSTFNVAGITFLDQNLVAAGRQVRAYLTQGLPGFPLRVVVRTNDAKFTAGGAPAPGIILSRTGDPSSDGRLDGRCFNVGARAIVGGLASGSRRFWTPKYNNGSSSGMDYWSAMTKFPVDPAQMADVVSYWRGQAADGGADLADGNDGGLYNGATYVTGIVGQAFSFAGAGSNHVFEVPPAGNLDAPARFTISLWVKAADPSSRFQALAGQGPGSLGYGLEISSSGGALGLNLGAQTDEASLTFVSDANGGDGFAFPANTWTHVAGVYDGSELRLYVNGLPAPGYAAQPLTGAVLPTGGYWSIGASPGTDDNELEGLIDDVAIFDRALSGEEIQGLFQRKFGGS